MERLTEKIGNTNCVKGCGSNCKYGFQYCTKEDWENCKTIDDVIDKLAEYENLEEQGRLVKLPCKVGDTVFKLKRHNYCPVGICHKDISCSECRANTPFGIAEGKFMLKELKEIGKTVFLTQAEAEQYQSSEIGFISKTEVLTLIEEIKCNDDIPKNYGTLLDIMRMIRNMPTVDNTDNGWIPCSERLPEESGYYLVTYHNWSDGNFLPKYNDTYVRRLHYQISEHFVGWNYPKNVDNRAENDCHKEVIAWQPLPEPFKERD